MSNLFTTRPGLMLPAGWAKGLLVGVGVLIGGLAAVGYLGPGPPVLPEVQLHATASHGTDTLAAATGPVDEEVEGLYTLDFLTGDLQCFVVYVRGSTAGKIGGLFKKNVIADLGIEKTKKPNYLLLTGQARFAGRGGQARPALSIVYVIDANTGAFSTYSIPWNSNLHVRGTPQAGALILLDKGIARTAVIRE